MFLTVKILTTQILICTISTFNKLKLKIHKHYNYEYLYQGY